MQGEAQRASELEKREAQRVSELENRVEEMLATNSQLLTEKAALKEAQGTSAHDVLPTV